jgi:hypothetical protein
MESSTMAKKIAQNTAVPHEQEKRKVARSAKTGEFVTKKFAKEHPSTTEVETVKIEPRRKKS